MGPNRQVKRRRWKFKVSTDQDTNSHRKLLWSPLSTKSSWARFFVVTTFSEAHGVHWNWPTDGATNCKLAQSPEKQFGNTQRKSLKKSKSFPRAGPSGGAVSTLHPVLPLRGAMKAGQNVWNSHVRIRRSRPQQANEARKPDSAVH